MNSANNTSLSDLADRLLAMSERDRDRVVAQLSVSELAKLSPFLQPSHQNQHSPALMAAIQSAKEEVPPPNLTPATVEFLRAFPLQSTAKRGQPGPGQRAKIVDWGRHVRRFVAKGSL